MTHTWFSLHVTIPICVLVSAFALYPKYITETIEVKEGMMHLLTGPEGSIQHGRGCDIGPGTTGGATQNSNAFLLFFFHSILDSSPWCCSHPRWAFPYQIVFMVPEIYLTSLLGDSQSSQVSKMGR